MGCTLRESNTYKQWHIALLLAASHRTCFSERKVFLGRICGQSFTIHICWRISGIESWCLGDSGSGLYQIWIEMMWCIYANTTAMATDRLDLSCSESIVYSSESFQISWPSIWHSIFLPCNDLLSSNVPRMFWKPFSHGKKKQNNNNPMVRRCLNNRPRNDCNVLNGWQQIIIIGIALFQGKRKSYKPLPS